MSFIENKCRCCLTMNAILTDRDIDEQTGEEVLYIMKMNYILPQFEFNKSKPFMICGTCGENLETLFKFKQEFYKRRNSLSRHQTNTTELNSICRCCLSVENTIKLDEELVEKIKLYLHDILDGNVCLESEIQFKLCEKCHKILTTFQEFEENLIYADRAFGNIAESNNIIEYEIKSEIYIKEESIENTELNDKHENYNSESQVQRVHDHQINKNEYEQIYECEYCSKHFTERKTLKIHLFIDHPGEKNYKCKYCSKRFHIICRLKQHLVVHTGERNFECKYCSKRFANVSALNAHLVSHFGVKKYKCIYCSERFSDHYILKRHYLAIHDDEKKYECIHCSRRFRNKAHLKKHILVHTGEKNYECQYCTKRFARNWDLKKHILIHTRSL